MFHDPAECANYGRKNEGLDRAKIFEISDLISMFQASRQNSTGPRAYLAAYGGSIRP